MQAHHNLFKLWHWVDHDLIYAKIYYTICLRVTYLWVPMMDGLRWATGPLVLWLVILNFSVCFISVESIKQWLWYSTLCHIYCYTTVNVLQYQGWNHCASTAGKLMCLWPSGCDTLHYGIWTACIIHLLMSYSVKLESLCTLDLQSNNCGTLHCPIPTVTQLLLSYNVKDEIIAPELPVSTYVLDLWSPKQWLSLSTLCHICCYTLEECVRRLLTWKEAMEEKGLRVNAGKTKIMICGTGLDLLQSSGEFPCAVFRTGVGSNSIFCEGCKHWVHKKCSGLKRLTEDPDYRCTRCKGTARPLDGRPQREVQVGPDKLEVVASFCYLGDMLSAAGGCELSTTTRVKTTWKKFQGAETSSLFPPPFFQDTWPCVQHVCAERNAPCQWNLASNKALPPASAAKWQSNDQTDLQC